MKPALTQWLKQHRIVWLAGLVSACSYTYLTMQSQGYGDANLMQLYSVSTLCAALSVLVWWSYHRVQAQVPILGLLVFAILFRAIGVFSFPLLEDDIFRFLWDGRMTIETGSAYALLPSDYFDQEKLGARFEEILGLINYPDIATVYGPSNQWVFALAYLISPGVTWPLQLIYAIADIALIGVLLKLAKPNMVLLYAWSPLMIKEFAFTAHPDVLGALFLLAAFLFYQRGLYFRCAILLALATGVKVFALMLVPLLLGLQWRAWLAFMVTALLIALPFGIIDAWFPAGLAAMGNDWLFNAPIYLGLQAWFSLSTIKTTLLLILACGCAAYWFACMRQWPRQTIRGDLMFAALFLCAPVLNPWYLVWLLPFAVIYPSLWAWVASLSVFLAYASGINLAGSDLSAYSLAPSTLLLEFTPIVMAALFSISHRHWRRRKET